MTLYYQINYTLTDVPDDAAYFHAQFRRMNPLPYKDVFTIARRRPRARAIMSARTWRGACNNNGWWGEGEIKFYMDGDNEFPTICGTGTEDYFCGTYNFDVGRKTPRRRTVEYETFTTPYAGLAASHPRRWPLQRHADALRPVSLAHRRSDPLRERSSRDDPSARLAQRRQLSAAAG